MIVVSTSSRFGQRVIMEEEHVILSWEADSVHVLRKVLYILVFSTAGTLVVITV